MTPEEFVDEVKNSEICPVGFDRTYREFQAFQKDALRALIEVHRVCEKNNVLYQMAWGSLLGMIRDNGQIPWDYDVDLFVPYKQKQSLISALNKDLSEEYYFTCPEVDARCRHMHLRVAPIEYRTEALHVDVFFFIGTPNEKEERRKFANRILYLSKKRNDKLINIYEESFGNPRFFAGFLLKRRIPALLPSLREIMMEYETLCNMYDSFESDYCISADIWATYCDMKSEILWDTEIRGSGIGQLRVPVRFEELLTILYGDYMSIPPLKDRLSEVLYSHARITTFQTKYIRKVSSILVSSNNPTLGAKE